MEKEVMGKEKEEVGGAGRLVSRSLCCLFGTESNSLISAASSQTFRSCGSDQVLSKCLLVKRFQTSSRVCPQENVRHNIRNRAVSKEELHLQFTWWWRRWHDEVARSSGSSCMKVTNVQYGGGCRQKCDKLLLSYPEFNSVSG